MADNLDQILFGGEPPPKPPAEAKPEKPPLDDILSKPAGQEVGEKLARKARGRQPQETYSPPFGAQFDVAGAANPREVRLALERYYSPDDIRRDKYGNWQVNDQGKWRKFEPEFLSKIAASAPSTALATGGAIGGTALGGPVMGVAGAAAGGGIGQGVQEYIKHLRGLGASPPEDVGKRMAKEGLLMGGLQAIPAVGGTVGRTAMDLLRSKGLGATPESIARGAYNIERGGQPPVVSIFPEAGGTAKKQDIARIVSYGGRYPGSEANLKIIDEDIRTQLRGAGLPPGEVDEFMKSIATSEFAPSQTEAGRSIVGAAQRQVTQMRETVDNELATVRGALGTETERLRVWSENPGRVGENVADAITDRRQQFSRQFNEAYRQVHEQGGSLRVVNLIPAMEEAQAIVAELSANPNAVPPQIKRLAEGARSVPVGEPPQLPAPGGQAAAPRPREWQEMETLEAAHNLRSELRALEREKSLSLTPDAHYAMIRRVEEKIDDAISELAASGGGLPAEAARELRRVDGLYREGIQVYRNATVRKLVRDARDGLYVDPELVARDIIKPGHVEETRAILSMLPGPVYEQVAQADMRRRLGSASFLEPTTGRFTLDGRRLLADIQREGPIMREVYGDAFVDNLQRVAREYAARDGALQLTALESSAIRDQLARYNSAKSELDEFVKTDPVGKLASNDPAVVDAALNAITKPGNEAQTIAAAERLNEFSPEWAAVQRANTRNLFASVFRSDPRGNRLVTGEALTDAFSRYTKRQLELLFRPGTVDDVREIGKNIRFLFPPSYAGGSEDAMHSGLAAGSIKAKAYFDPRAFFPRWYYAFWDYGLRNPWVMKMIMGVINKSPTQKYMEASLGAIGRMIINAIRQEDYRKKNVQNTHAAEQFQLDVASAAGVTESAAPREPIANPQNPSVDTLRERMGPFAPPQPELIQRPGSPVWPYTGVRSI